MPVKEVGSPWSLVLSVISNLLFNPPLFSFVLMQRFLSDALYGEASLGSTGFSSIVCMSISHSGVCNTQGDVFGIHLKIGRGYFCQPRQNLLLRLL